MTVSRQNKFACLGKYHGRADLTALYYMRLARLCTLLCPARARGLMSGAPLPPLKGVIDMLSAQEQDADGALAFKYM
jgi:hypothetical protein